MMSPTDSTAPQTQPTDPAIENVVAPSSDPVPTPTAPAQLTSSEPVAAAADVPAVATTDTTPPAPVTDDTVVTPPRPPRAPRPPPKQRISDESWDAWMQQVAAQRAERQRADAAARAQAKARTEAAARKQDLHAAFAYLRRLVDAAESASEPAAETISDPLLDDALARRVHAAPADTRAAIAALLDATGGRRGARGRRSRR